MRIAYYENHMETESGAPYYTLTFTITFPHANDVVNTRNTVRLKFHSAVISSIKILRLFGRYRIFRFVSVRVPSHMETESGAPYYTLTFTITFPHANDVVIFVY